MSSIVIQGDTSGSIIVEAPAVAGTHTLTLPKATGNIATDATVGLGMKNRIINGDMRIAQRGTGTVNPNGAYVYSVDRTAVYTPTSGIITAGQSTTSPDNFTHSFLVTSTTTTSVGAGDINIISHRIEGNNIADLGWGTSAAKTVTLSFWVRSSLTGTFGGAFKNNAYNRNYLFEYTISSANTWEKKTITVTGDTTGTWNTDNNSGIQIVWSLGTGSTYSTTAGSWVAGQYFNATGSVNLVATSGATFYITGVQLEKGENATPFENRMYSQELAMCQRYFYKVDGSNGLSTIGAGMSVSTTDGRIAVQYPVKMRASPTTTFGGTLYLINTVGSGIVVTSIAANYGGAQGAMISFGVASGLTAGAGQVLFTDSGASNYFQASAEL